MAYIIALALLLVFPVVSSAQGTPGLQAYVPAIIEFFNLVLIPFLFGIAFLIFVTNAIRYFVLEAANEKGREKARTLALYTVLAFVLLIVFWGLVNLIAFSTGLGGCSPITSDYLPGGGADATNCYTAPVSAPTSASAPVNTNPLPVPPLTTIPQPNP